MPHESKRFHLYKWYIDLIDDSTDDLTIIYLGELKWNLLRFRFTNVIRFLRQQNLISYGTFAD
jgi:hypothetical protein